MAVAGWPRALSAQTAGADTSIYQFVLDYDVPESPAFVALGTTPGNVLRGGAAKPVVVNALTNALRTGRLDGGLAVDVSPMVFARPTFTSFDQYRTSLAGKVLRRVLASFGTVVDETDTASLRVGAGLRVTLHDSNDPLSDPGLYRRVDSLLLAVLRPAHHPTGHTGGAGPIVTLPNKDSLAAAYREAREAALAKPGWGVALGWGLAAALRHSTLAADSLRDAVNTIWLAARYKFKTPATLLGTAQWRQVRSGPDALRAGAALRATFDAVSAAAELVYDGASHTWQPGGNAEIRVLPRTRVVLGLVSDAASASNGGRPRLRLRTDLKWDLAETAR